MFVLAYPREFKKPLP